MKYDPVPRVRLYTREVYGLQLHNELRSKRVVLKVHGRFSWLSSLEHITRAFHFLNKLFSINLLFSEQWRLEAYWFCQSKAYQTMPRTDNFPNLLFLNRQCHKMLKFWVMRKATYICYIPNQMDS